jgi:hypothetical protein
MYQLSDVVEVGHLKDIAGTVEISFIFSHIPSEEIKNECRKIMDYLDHCLITDNKEAADLSHRYFLLSKCTNLFEDIHYIMSYFTANIIPVEYIKIQRQKETYKETVKLDGDKELLGYNTED